MYTKLCRGWRGFTVINREHLKTRLKGDLKTKDYEERPSANNTFSLNSMMFQFYYLYSQHITHMYIDDIGLKPCCMVFVWEDQGKVRNPQNH
jgi:hypothetical protein